jgi:hypothetical protein
MIEASEDSSVSDQADPQEQPKITSSVERTNEQSSNMSETPLNATLDHEMEGEVIKFM